MKYPNIILFRYDIYSHIDIFFENHKDKLLCSIHTINNNAQLNKLFDPNNHLLITYGDKDYTQRCK